jgi:hypothetical protein
LDAIGEEGVIHFTLLYSLTIMLTAAGAIGENGISAQTINW